MAEIMTEPRSAERTGPFRVGVTGSLGSGKSTLCRLLAERGYAVIDADQTSRAVTAPGGPALEELQAVFGDDILNAAGELDRAVLARRAFIDPATRDRLQAILHPRIRAALAAAIDELGRAGHGVVVIEAAMILEGGHQDFYDMLVVVTAPQPAKLERAAERGMDRAEAARRLALQWSDDRKAAAADWVVENDDDRTALAREADRLSAGIREASKRNGSH